MTVSDLLVPDNTDQQGCYKLLTACSKLVDNLWQAVQTEKIICWRLVDELVTRCEIFACVSWIQLLNSVLVGYEELLRPRFVLSSEAEGWGW
jgi:hypothetical protein